jgi:cardiolipin synthase (CMP-forming)
LFITYHFTGMTTANKVTILRVLLIPFFIVLMLYYVKNGEEIFRTLGLVAFALCSISDAVDGYIARRYNQRSELGAILDPLADKLLLVSGIILLSLNNGPLLPRLPLWLAGVIISRDVLMLIGLAVIHMVCGKATVRPRWIGKTATVLQMATVIWALLKWQTQWLEEIALAAAICTGVSGLLYIWDGMKQLSAHPTSSASR